MENIEIPTYYDLNEFREKHIFDFSLYAASINYLNYLNLCRKKYDCLLVNDSVSQLNEYYKKSEATDILRKLDDRIESTDLDYLAGFVEGEFSQLIVFSSGIVFTEKEYKEYLSGNEDSYNILFDIECRCEEISLLNYHRYFKREYDDEVLNLTYLYMQKVFEYADANKKYWEETEKKREIIQYINDQIESEKLMLLRGIPQKHVEDNTDCQPLTGSQKDKIGLFIRSGIVAYLREKNPGINDSRLAKFLRELTSEKLENSESVRPHLNNNLGSNKHPFFKNGKLEFYDLVLKKYGIIPQADQ